MQTAPGQCFSACSRDILPRLDSQRGGVFARERWFVAAANSLLAKTQFESLSKIAGSKLLDLPVGVEIRADVLSAASDLFRCHSPQPSPTKPKKISPAQYTALVYNGSTRFASPISGRSRLIPELETTRLDPSHALAAYCLA